MANGTPWTRNETILALQLFHKIPFSKISSKNSKVIALSKEIDRTPSAISFKLGNFGRLDPKLKERDISGLRHGSKLDAEIWEEFGEDSSALDKAVELIRSRGVYSVTEPEIPSQSPGVNFGIVDGKIGVVLNDQEDSNNVPVLQALHIPLFDAVEKSLKQLSGGNQPFGILLDVMTSYHQQLNGDVATLNYALLFSTGIRLKAAYETLKTKIENGELPEFEYDCVFHIETILQLHGPFILSSSIGAELVIAAERYQRNPDQERAYINSLNRLSKKIINDKGGVFHQSTIDTFEQIGKLNQDDSEFERRYVFGSRAAKNLTIVLSATAVLGSVAFIPVAGPYLAVALGILSANQTGSAIKELGEDTQAGLDNLRASNAFAKFRNFFVSNHAALAKVVSLKEKVPEWFESFSKQIRGSASGNFDNGATQNIPESLKVGNIVQCKLIELNSLGVEVSFKRDKKILTGFIENSEMGVLRPRITSGNLEKIKSVKAEIKSINRANGSIILAIGEHERRRAKYAARKERSRKNKAKR